jgi:hypothetical protein
MQTCWNVSSRSYLPFLYEQNPHVWISSPRGVSTTTYWQMTHIWWHWWKDYTTWHLACRSQWPILHKASFTLSSLQNLFNKILVYKGQDNPHTLHVNHAYSSGRNSTKFETQKPSLLGVYGPELLLVVASQVLKHPEMVMRFFRSFHD